MSDLDERDLEASLDVTAWMQEQGLRELMPGRYSVTLQFNNPEYTRPDRYVTATMVISEAAGEDVVE